MEDKITINTIDNKSVSATQAGRGRRSLFKIATLAFGLLGGLIVAEVGLRIVGYSSPDFFISDESLGYSLIPNMSGTFRKEGYSLVQINSEGFRDVEHTASKPTDVYRIAFLGDSFLEGMQVEQSELFLNYVKDGIQNCGIINDKKIEVFNFGVKGYGTAQELIVMREKVWKYSPDMVVLLMTTNNDITDNSPVFRHNPIPFFVYRNDVLTLDDSFRSSNKFVFQNSAIGRWLVRLKNNLRIVQAIGEIHVAIKHRYKKWKPRSSNSTVSAGQAAAPMTELGIDSQIYKPPADPDWKAAWSVTEGIIGRMKSEIENKGAKFLIITGSNGVQVLPKMKEREGFEKRLGVEDLYYPDKRIADFGRSNSIPVITLAPVLGDYAAREKTYLHGFGENIGYGHWNQLGHRIAGDTIAQKICQGPLLLQSK